MKALIGIGDSWTQGQGGVAIEEFSKRGGRVDGPGPEMEYLLPQENSNSWVNVLCRDYYKDLTPINLGVRGYGNRGAVKHLYIDHDKVKEVDGGILIFLMSSRIRFDMPSENGYNPSRWKFRTFYPNYDVDRSKKLSMTEASELNFYESYYTEYFAKTELLLNLLEAKLWATARNMDFYFASAFEPADDLFLDDNQYYGLPSQLKSTEYLTPDTNYYKILNVLNGTPTRTWNDYMTMPMPDMYITNCVHPTIEGYLEIADHMYNKIELLREETNLI